MAQQSMPLNEVIRKVKSMVHDRNARNIVQGEKYTINSVTWEDCARNKGSVWGPCISDMTLQVGNNRMPVIRENNYTDKTWDVDIEKLPIVVGNQVSSSDANESDFKYSGPPKNNNKLRTVTLKEYLRDFDKYMTSSPDSNQNNNNNNNNVSWPMSAASGLFEDNSPPKINLLRKDESKDSHVIVSSQACFLPIEQGKETLFNVALFNYQSRKQDPAVLAIVATSKGTSAQIIEGRDQKLLFNNNGQKADFIGQRLTDNRIERGVKDLSKPMTTQEKQDNCIIIIQVPLKQKPQFRGSSYGYGSGGFGGGWSMEESGGGAENDLFSDFGMAPSAAPQPQMQAMSFSSNNYNNNNNNSNFLKGMVNRSRNESANVESAIVKVAPKTKPVCKCGEELEKLQLQFCYDNYGKPASQMTSINCDGCGKNVVNNQSSGDEDIKSTIVWHCKKEKSAWQHKHGYDLCVECAKKQLKFDELNGMKKIERDERYPIRVTLQYYKSTDNGVINKDIMKSIAKQLKESQSQSDFVGSLVTEYNPNRPTEWVRYLPFRMDVGQVRNDKNFGLVRDVLGNLGLNQYYGTFIENEISDARLVLLEDSDLKLLFKKVGPMCVFRHWLRSYKKDLDKNGIDINGGNNNQNNVDQQVDFGLGLFVSKD